MLIDLLDIRWLIVLFKQFLNHDSNALKLWGLVTFLTLDHSSFAEFLCESGPLEVS